jgi:hypothetical protein
MNQEDKQMIDSLNMSVFSFEQFQIPKDYRIQQIHEFPVKYLCLSKN